jgi:mono/diheme cytochrome c family protein
MRWTRWIAIALPLAALLGAVSVLSCTTYGRKEAAPTAEQKVARGEYLSHVCGCVDCHTPGYFYGAPDWSRNLSGSDLGWRGPWGVSFARNLTPHPTSGIGTWTEDQIVTAIRTGRRPDNSMLLPPMPWLSLARLTDEDAYALATYLKSLPPIDHKAIDRLPPDAPFAGSTIAFPPPPAWDAPRTPATGDTSGAGGH